MERNGLRTSNHFLQQGARTETCWLRICLHILWLELAGQASPRRATRGGKKDSTSRGNASSSCSSSLLLSPSALESWMLL